MSSWLKKSSFFVIMSFSCFLPGCFQAEHEPTKGLVVINVLDKGMHEDCHIQGSISVPFEEVAEFSEGIDKQEAEVVVYCSNYMCSASGSTAKMLLAKGFKHVWAYEAGLAEWYQKGLPVEGACTQKYLQRTMAAPDHEDDGVPVITTEQLKEKMGL